MFALSSPPFLRARDPVLPDARRSLGVRKRLWVVPAAAAEAESHGGATLHTVQTGETLAQIALAYGVPVERIQEAVPKGPRGKRAVTSSNSLKAGQQLLVPSVDTRSTTGPLAGQFAGAQGYLTQQAPLLAAVLGGSVVAAGALQLLAAKVSAARRSADSLPKAPAPSAAAPAAPAPGSASAASEAGVSCAVAEVRVLLQDAVVGMQAVESALAAVRRAAVAAGTAAPAAPPVVAAAVEAENAGEAASTDPLIATAAAAVEPLEQPSEAADAALGVGAEQSGMPVPLAAAAEPDAAPTALSPHAAAAEPAAEPAAASAVAAPAPAVLATAAAAAHEVPGPAPARWEGLDVFDTAAQVAIARKRVEAALEAALGLTLAVPLVGPMAAALLQVPSPGGGREAEAVPAADAAEAVLGGSSAQGAAEVGPLDSLMGCAGDEGQQAPASPEAAVAAAELSERAAGVLQSVDVLLASLSDSDEAALDGLQGEAAAGRAAAVVEGAAATGADAVAASGQGLEVGGAASAELVPQPTPAAVPGGVPPLGAADSSSTASWVLDLPSAAAADLLPEPEGGAPPLPLPLPLPQVTAEALEALVRPLGGGVAGQVLDRIRDINRLLEEEQQRADLVVVGAELAPQDAAAAAEEEGWALVGHAAPAPATVESAARSGPEPTARSAQLEYPLETELSAAALTTFVAGATAATVSATAAATAVLPSAVVHTLNRTFNAPSGGSGGGPGGPPTPSGPPATYGTLAAPPQRPLLPPPPPEEEEEEEEEVPPSSVAAHASWPLEAGPLAAPSPLPSPWDNSTTLLDFAEPPPRQPLFPSPFPPSQPRGKPGPAAAATHRPPSSPQPPPAAAPSPGADAAADSTLVNLKSGLLDLVYGTSRGVSATAVQRAAIEEFVVALEGRNPHTVPTDAVSVLSGRWKLVYTSSVGCLLLLGALDSLPLVDVGDVVQEVDPHTLTATNKIDLAVPMLLSLRAEAGLEVRSPRQFKVRFTRVGLDTYLATPRITAALEVPDSLTVLGATLDLSPLRRLLEPLNSGLEAAQGLLGMAVSPEFSVDSLPLPPGVSRGSLSEAASLWMLTTYLDDTLRVSRDDEGRVFVMLKDGGIYPGDASRYRQ